MNETPDFPYEWMTAAAAFLAFVGWAKRQEGWEAITAIARSFVGARGRRFTVRQVRTMRELSFALNRKLQESKGDRVNAICLHNNGGDIDNVDTPKFLTVYDSQSTGLKIDSAEAWQRVPLSTPYQEEIIEPMLKRQLEPFVVETEELADENYLKAHYQADSITKSVVCLAKATRKTVWYVSVNYKELPDEPDEDDKSSEAAAARLSRAVSFSVARRMASRLADFARQLPDPSELPLDEESK